MALSWFSFSSASLWYLTTLATHSFKFFPPLGLATLHFPTSSWPFQQLLICPSSPSSRLQGWRTQGLALISPLFPHFLYNSTILIYLASVHSSIFLLFISTHTSCHCLPFSILKLPSLLHSGWLPLQVPHCNWGLHPFPHVPALLPLVSFQDPSASVPSRLTFSLLS